MCTPWNRYRQVRSRFSVVQAAEAGSTFHRAFMVLSSAPSVAGPELLLPLFVLPHAEHRVRQSKASGDMHWERRIIVPLHPTVLHPGFHACGLPPDGFTIVTVSVLV